MNNIIYQIIQGALEYKIENKNHLLFCKEDKTMYVENSINSCLKRIALDLNIGVYEEENAKGKLIKKNLDMIVLNSLRDEGAGFANATNKIKIFTPTEEQSFTLKSKEEVARDILNFIAQKL